MAQRKVRKSGKKNRKYGRNKAWCEAYRLRRQRERNKIAKLLRHIARVGATDHTAVHCYNNLPDDLKPADRRRISPVKRERYREAAIPAGDAGGLYSGA